MCEAKKTVPIMDIGFYNGTQRKFMEQVVDPTFKGEGKQFIVTANPEIVMETRRNRSYKEILQSADHIVPDGIGILLAAKRKKTRLEARVAGYDLFVDMLAYADEKGARCFFLGAKEETNQVAVEKIKTKYPNIVVVGRQHGYIEVEDEQVAKDIAQVNPDFIFVALGFPKQEEWIHRYLSLFYKGIFIGLGGSFDVIAGNVKRAPNLFIKLRLEWFYRIALQPSRWSRLVPLMKFAWLTFRRKI